MGSNSPKLSRGARIASLQNVVDGLTAHAEKIPRLTICARTMTAQELIDELNVIIAVAGLVERAREEWVEAVRGDREARRRGRAFLPALRQTLLAGFARHEEILADFGLTPRQVLTPEQRAAASMKGKVTRMQKARGPLP